ncbi:MAG: serine hydrolase, partial [Bacteroidota bacterium]
QGEDADRRPEGYLASYLQDRIDFDGLLLGEVSPDLPIEKLIYGGVDVFLINGQVDQQIQAIKQLIAQDLWSEKRLNERVYKVLMAKAWVALDTSRPQVNRSHFARDFYNKQFPIYLRQLYEASISLVNNPQSILPLKSPFKQKFRLIHVGSERLKTFNRYFAHFADHRVYWQKPDPKRKLAPLDFKRHRWHPLVITLDQLNLDAQQDRAFLNSINQLAQKTTVVCINFGNPLNLQQLDTTIAQVQVFERNEWTMALTPQLLFGAIQAKGQLPLTVASHLPFGKNIRTPVTRLKYASPEEVGIASYKLVGIDALVKNAIAEGISPGAQVMVVKDAKIIYQKAFGHHTYDKKQRVEQEDLYDVASITKIAATTLGFMKLYETKKLKLNDPLRQHLSLLRTASIGKINLKRLLTHQSGLQPNMPIAEYILYQDSTEAVCNRYFCRVPQPGYAIQVADSMYLQNEWVDSLWEKVYRLEPRRRKRFRYSDVNFNLLQKVVEQESGSPLDNFVEEIFYAPLGLRHCLYRPLDVFPSKRIIPTERDERWRKQTLRGYVHDESAALLGGVGGNAGLFANSNDLAIIGQMLLNGGHYGGHELLNKATIDLFTSAKHGNHRGLGFDLNQKKKPSSCSDKASKQTFGHTGFTGTCMWMDPKDDLIFIFLTNRIYPDVRNRRIFRSKIRSRIHTIIYEALNTYDPAALFEDSPESMPVQQADLGI